MYYYYKPQLKIKDGAATADYKSLIQRALKTSVPSPEGREGQEGPGGSKGEASIPL